MITDPATAILGVISFAGYSQITITKMVQEHNPEEAFQ
jgi:hypothetical protein